MTDKTRLSKYEILEELGRGGFGVVYKARDVVLNRVVAVKVLHPNLVNDPGFVSRFRNEAQLAAQLDHSNIVSVYDFGEYQGLYYIAMAYMPGGSLKDMLQKEGALPEEKSLTVLSQVSDGLNYAHKKGIIHRDLKPGNILFDEEGQSRISDLGFAKALHTDSSVSLSMSGGLVGTPAYMAPEVWRGELATLQTDIYSLGCILYEMLTGEVLFEGKTPAEVMTRHVIDGAQFKHDLPDGSQNLLYKCLTKDPKERFQNIKAIREAYEQFQLENNFDIEAVILQEDAKPIEKLHPDSIYKTPLQEVRKKHSVARESPTMKTQGKVDSQQLETSNEEMRELEPVVGEDKSTPEADEIRNEEYEPLPKKKDDKKWILIVSLGVLAISLTMLFFSLLNDRKRLTINAVVSEIPTQMPSPTPIYKPTKPPSKTSTRTPTQMPTITPTKSFTGNEVIGHSVLERPLEVFRFGTGEHAHMIIAGIHGGYEWNTVTLACELIEYLEKNPSVIPDDKTLYILPNLNPDGYEKNLGPDGRANANNVDINRNWDSNWQATWYGRNCWSLRPITAGDYPESEPETRALKRFLLDRKVEAVISYHSAVSSIFAGGYPYDEVSLNLANILAMASPYYFPPNYGDCLYTGQFIDWASDQGIAAVDIELTNHQDTDYFINLNILVAFVEWNYPQ